MWKGRSVSIAMSSRCKALHSCLPRIEYACWSVHKLAYQISINLISIRVIIIFALWQCSVDAVPMEIEYPSIKLYSSIYQVEQSLHNAVVSSANGFPISFPNIFCNLLLPFLTYRLKSSQVYQLIQSYFSTRYYRKAAVLKQEARSGSIYILLLSSKVFIQQQPGVYGTYRYVLSSTRVYIYKQIIAMETLAITSLKCQ